MSDSALSIDADERKRLGQFFTGEPLARVLAALTDASSARSVIDPMAGSGDMLAAVNAMGASPTRVTAVEIDPAAAAICVGRLAGKRAKVEVRTGDAFDPSTWLGDRDTSWDLVITNPPYVRYQRTTTTSAGRVRIPSATDVRKGLLEILDQRIALGSDEADVFRALAEGYSGLADLAVPSWILCAALVAPGGRLAMVVPDTWLSRDYALPVLYLLRRCFDIEFVVEDGEASWFEDALVRTTLVVARRVTMRPWDEAVQPRSHVHARLTSSAADARSPVGALYPGTIRPEHRLADCLAGVSTGDAPVRAAGLHADRATDAAFAERLVAQAGATPWGRRLEAHLQTGAVGGAPLFSVPHRLRSAADVDPDRLCTLDDLGWSVGQGLRTGANRFFYCELKEHDDDWSTVQFDQDLSRDPLQVPSRLLRVAVRKQSDLQTRGGVAEESLGRLLVLDGHALEEDIEEVAAAGVQAAFELIPQPLADLVRRAALLDVGTPAAPRRIPELSAVATNVRRADRARPGRAPRFWYQLPPLASRHVGEVFIPRINHGHPAPATNPTGVVIDANFSTFWLRTGSGSVSAAALALVLGSSWAAAALESIGTVMGGGALKVEATQLRRLPLPILTPDDVRALDRHGRKVRANSTEARDAADSILWEAAGLKAGSRRAVASLMSELLSARSVRG